MLVHEDPGAGTIHVRLAPAGGTAPLQLMTGKWRFAAGALPACAACMPGTTPCCVGFTAATASWVLQLLAS
jgi:hypothetical protein